MRNSSRSADIGVLADYAAMPTSQQPKGPSPADTEVSHNVSEQRDAVDSAHIREHQEIGGRSGPEPTRFGDWEKNGRCIDF
jgi:hypothetical protein